MSPLVVQTRTPARPAGKTPLRVFLSYSHLDFELAGAFVKHFKQLASRFDVEVFHDDDRLKAGYLWEKVLLDELERSRVLIFLVSDNSLQEEGYCLRTEFPVAVRKGLRIVPVLVRECLWKGQPIHVDGAVHTLDARQALPTRDGSPLPLTRWGKRDHAWLTVMEGLGAVLEEEGAAPVVGRKPAAEGAVPVRADLVPYLCDQNPAVLMLDQQLPAWGDGALVVLVKGRYEDNPAMFWERLRLEHLAPFVSERPLRGSALGEGTPLLLPVDGQGTPAEIRAAILYELSRALASGNRYRIDGAPALTRHLRQHSGTIAIVATPDSRAPLRLRAAVESLLGLLEEVAAKDVLRRTVVAVNLEHPELCGEQLVKKWKLGRFTRSLVVEVGPLDPVNVDHARGWYHSRRIRETFRVPEGRVTALFAATPELRLRSFDEALEPLLNPSPR